jgi:hypothetical protein
MVMKMLEQVSSRTVLMALESYHQTITEEASGRREGWQEVE